MIKSVLGIAVAVLYLGFSNQAHAQASQAGLSVCASSSLSVTGTSGNTLLSKCGHSVVLTNVGSNEAFYLVGNASTTTATTSSASLPAGNSIVLDVGDNAPYLAAITGSSTTTLRITQGQGMTALAGGAGTSGAGGGAVTIASGGVASGAYASGSIAAGAYSLGSFVAGALADGAVTTIGTEADAAYAGSGSTTEIGALKGIYAAATAPLAAGTNAIGSVTSIGSQYPTGAVAITASPSNGTTGAVVATLAHVTGHTVYICGFAARANATAATTVNLVVSGTITGSLNFLQWIAPLASGIGLTEEIFTPCVPASALNTDIVVTTGAPGSGGADSVSAWGYSL